MKSKKRLYGAIALTLLMATAATAQPGAGKGSSKGGMRDGDGFRGQRRGPGVEMMATLGQLDLSMEQQEMMLKLRYEHQLANLPRRQQMQEKFQVMKTLSEDPVSNQKKLKKLASDIGEMKVEGQVNRYQFEQKIWNDVLSDEQRQKIGSFDKLFPGPGDGPFGFDGPRGPRGGGSFPGGAW